MEVGRVSVLKTCITSQFKIENRKWVSVLPKGFSYDYTNRLWIFIGRTDAEAGTPILWPPDVKNWLIAKEPDARNNWRQEEKGTTEDEMAGWLDGPTRWTWIWVNSRSWWLTGRPGVLQSMGLQRVGHHWATELNWKSKGKWSYILL